MDTALTSAEEYLDQQLKVHFRNPKTGVIEKISPYIRHCHRDHGVLFERDGQIFNEDWSVFKGPAAPWFKLTTKTQAEAAIFSGEKAMEALRMKQAEIEELKAQLAEEQGVRDDQEKRVHGGQAAHEAHKVGQLKPAVKPPGGAPVPRGV